jgi:adenosylhomocysteine nucleosidase
MCSLEIKPCHFATVLALGIESGSFEDMLAGSVRIRGTGFFIKEGGLHGRRVVVVRSGAGMENAARATEVLIDGHHPGIVISAGFAGGLDPALKRHDILIADSVVDMSGREIFIGRSAPAADASAKGQSDAVSNLTWTSPCPLDYAKLSFPGLHFGKLLSAERVIREPDEKQSLHRRHLAAAVDMETFAVAEVCRRRGVPLCAVRVIHDAAGEALPADVERLLRQKTDAARLGAALAAIWRRPGALKDLWMLKEVSLAASMQLADCLANIVALPLK